MYYTHLLLSSENVNYKMVRTIGSHVVKNTCLKKNVSPKKKNKKGWHLGERTPGVEATL